MGPLSERGTGQGRAIRRSEAQGLQSDCMRRAQRETWLPVLKSHEGSERSKTGKEPFALHCEGSRQVQRKAGQSHREMSHTQPLL